MIQRRPDFYVSPNFASSKLLQHPTVEDLVDVYEDRVRGFILEPAAALVSRKNTEFAVPEIEALQDAKAVALAAYRKQHPGSDPSEDRTLEVLSRVAIDVRADAARAPSIAAASLPQPAARGSASGRS